MYRDCDDNKNDIEKLLLAGETVTFEPQGYSMYPVIRPDDAVIVEPVDVGDLKRGDVVVYRRMNSILVMHRIYKIKGDECWLVGDNQSAVEGPVDVHQLRGKMISYVRTGKKIDVNDASYVVLTRIWLFLRPIRKPVSWIVHRLKLIITRGYS